jgi:hypothetical protein
MEHGTGHPSPTSGPTRQPLARPANHWPPSSTTAPPSPTPDPTRLFRHTLEDGFATRATATSSARGFGWGSAGHLLCAERGRFQVTSTPVPGIGQVSPPRRRA